MVQSVMVRGNGEYVERIWKRNPKCKVEKPDSITLKWGSGTNVGGPPGVTGIGAHERINCDLAPLTEGSKRVILEGSFLVEVRSFGGSFFLGVLS
jgi:hypothetical protein